RLTYRASEALSAAAAWRDCKVDFRLTELGCFGSDDDVAHHCEFTTAAEAKAGDSGDDGFAKSRRSLPVAGHEILAKSLGVGFRRHFLDVGAGCERFIGSSQHNGV